MFHLLPGCGVCYLRQPSPPTSLILCFLLLSGQCCSFECQVSGALLALHWLSLNSPFTMLVPVPWANHYTFIAASEGACGTAW